MPQMLKQFLAAQKGHGFVHVKTRFREQTMEIVQTLGYESQVQEVVPG